jgi:hypothetical protein
MSQQVLLLQFVRQLHDKSVEQHGAEDTETVVLSRYMESLEGDIRKAQNEAKPRPRHRPLAHVYPLAKSSAYAGGRFATAGIWR